MIRCLMLVLLMLPAISGRVARGAPPEDALQAMRQPGAVGLLRHAHAPGVGDPAEFRLGECSTQRNLDEAGREQARQIGARLRAVGTQAQVFSSAWCRTQDTAVLLGLGPVQVMPALNSFFTDSGAAPGQTTAVRRFIADWSGPPLLLVTHQVNITALTGLNLRDGELIVLRPGPAGLAVAGRVQLARP